MTKLSWIKSQILPGEAPAETASRLNTAIEIENPNPQGKVPAPINLEEIRELVPDGEAFEVMETRTYDRILEAIQLSDRLAIGNHIRALLKGGKISPETVAKIQPVLGRTIPDPNWQPRVWLSPAVAAGYGLVLTNEVVEAID